ncbi:DMT family transporter [Quadrisphaera sp. DSM 44207]|uniref:EamA family transporter n=1 Tax=Quadrisphaera sp. DSM 44207 TaxID=1881057 RepID=UPI00088A9EA2|nr:EamA family transporter [Quadrisphaera sp. DSM 44207]SDQ66520.1 inner membrane transporter RhtA [Quadrisphaera sp. DSM 44207]
MAASPADRVPPQLVLAAAALSLQVGAAVATLLFPALGATGVLALRMGVGALCLVVLGRAWRAVPRGRTRGLVVAFGAVLGTMNLLFYLSLERIPLGVAVALELLGPLGVAVAGSRTRRHLLWVALAVAGLAVLLGPTVLGEASAGGAGAGLDPAGVALALAAGAAWAGYILLGSRLAGAVSGTAGLAWAMVAASAVLVPLGAATAGAALLEPEHLLAGAAVALLSGVLPYSLELATLRRLSPRAFGVMMSLEPAVAVLAGLVVAGQRPGPAALAGIALVVAASLGAVPGSAEASAEAAPDAAAGAAPGAALEERGPGVDAVGPG